MRISLNFLEREMFLIKVVDKIKTHILCSGTFPENRAVYEIMWTNMVEPERPHTKIRRMRFVCWLTMAADTLITFSTY